MCDSSQERALLTTTSADLCVSAPLDIVWRPASCGVGEWVKYVAEFSYFLINCLGLTVSQFRKCLCNNQGSIHADSSFLSFFLSLNLLLKKCVATVNVYFKLRVLRPFTENTWGAFSLVSGIGRRLNSGSRAARRARGNDLTTRCLYLLLLLQADSPPSVCKPLSLHDGSAGTYNQSGP